MSASGRGSADALRPGADRRPIVTASPRAPSTRQVQAAGSAPGRQHDSASVITNAADGLSSTSTTPLAPGKPGATGDVGRRQERPQEGHKCPILADIVARIEHRTTKRISRKSFSRHLCCCIACQRHYGGPRPILDETIWSLTSLRGKRINGSRNFRSTPQNGLLQQYRHFSDIGVPWVMSTVGGTRTGLRA